MERRVVGCSYCTASTRNSDKIRSMTSDAIALAPLILQEHGDGPRSVRENPRLGSYGPGAQRAHLVCCVFISVVLYVVPKMCGRVLTSRSIPWTSTRYVRLYRLLSSPSRLTWASIRVDWLGWSIGYSPYPCSYPNALPGPGDVKKRQYTPWSVYCDLAAENASTTGRDSKVYTEPMV